MSDLQMQQEDHPIHNVPKATEQYAGDVLPIIPPGTPNTWSDLSQASGPGSLTKEQAKRSDTPVKRTGTPN